MPEPLIEATDDLHKKRIDPETWQQRVAARAPYRLVPKQVPDDEGFQRHQCPAAAGRLHCPLKPPLPADHPKRHLLPIVDPKPSPVGPLKICKQESITIPPEAGAKHAQDLAYGSAEWTQEQTARHLDPRRPPHTRTPGSLTSPTRTLSIAHQPRAALDHALKRRLKPPTRPWTRRSPASVT